MQQVCRICEKLVLVGLSIVILFWIIIDNKSASVKPSFLVIEEEDVVLNDLYSVTQGEVPAVFEAIICNETFFQNTRIRDVNENGLVYYTESICMDEDGMKEIRFVVIDKYGDTTVHIVKTALERSVQTFIANDGGILYILGYYDNEDATDRKDAIVTKCDAAGNIEWSVEISNVALSCFEYLFEKNGDYYIIGVGRDNDAEKSSNALCVIKLNQNNGENTTNWLDSAEISIVSYAKSIDKGFELTGYSRSASDDAIRMYRWIVNYDAELVQKDFLEKSDTVADFTFAEYIGGVDFTRERLGEIKELVGSPIFSFAYDGQILVVSTRPTIGLFTVSELTNARIRGYERVYTYFDEQMEILWQAVLS